MYPGSFESIPGLHGEHLDQSLGFDSDSPQAIKWLDRVKLARQGAFRSIGGIGCTARSPLQLVSNEVVATGMRILSTTSTVPALEVISDGGRDLFIGKSY